jgi:hypothetical protein
VYSRRGTIRSWPLDRTRTLWIRLILSRTGTHTRPLGFTICDADLKCSRFILDRLIDIQWTQNPIANRYVPDWSQLFLRNPTAQDTSPNPDGWARRRYPSAAAPSPEISSHAAKALNTDSYGSTRSGEWIDEDGGRFTSNRDGDCPAHAIVRNRGGGWTSSRN